MNSKLWYFSVWRLVVDQSECITVRLKILSTWISWCRRLENNICMEAKTTWWRRWLISVLLKDELHQFHRQDNRISRNQSTDKMIRKILDDFKRWYEYYQWYNTWFGDSERYAGKRAINQNYRDSYRHGHIACLILFLRLFHDLPKISPSQHRSDIQRPVKFPTSLIIPRSTSIKFSLELVHPKLERQETRKPSTKRSKLLWRPHENNR